MMLRKRTIQSIVALAALLCSVHISLAQATDRINNPAFQDLVNGFYTSHNGGPVWYSGNAQSCELRNIVRRRIDSADYDGLNKRDYPLPPDNEATNLSETDKIDHLFTHAFLAYSLDLLQGTGITEHLNNDEISRKYSTATYDQLLKLSKNIGSAEDLNSFFASLEPSSPAYITLKNRLRQQIDSANTKKIAAISLSMNILRWIDHFHFDKYILINIPGATLRYYENRTEVLKMKAVVGKPKTRTPRFSSWCTRVIFYPYWNVPRSIAIKELLPAFKKNPGKIMAENMQVLNSSGKVVDPYSLNWSSFNGNNFPYTIRQCTGCDNALGVIKFDLTDPFNVYLHDTNFKTAFSSNERFFSHGCIRISDPIALADHLLESKTDSNFLRACLKGQEPVVRNLKERVPVFVVYMTACVEQNNVVYMRDIYHLAAK